MLGEIDLSQFRLEKGKGTAGRRSNPELEALKAEVQKVAEGQGNLYLAIPGIKARKLKTVNMLKTAIRQHNEEASPETRLTYSMVSVDGTPVNIAEVKASPDGMKPTRGRLTPVDWSRLQDQVDPRLKRDVNAALKELANAPAAGPKESGRKRGRPRKVA